MSLIFSEMEVYSQKVRISPSDTELNHLPCYKIRCRSDVVILKYFH